MIVNCMAVAIRIPRVITTGKLLQAIILHVHSGLSCPCICNILHGHGWHNSRYQWPLINVLMGIHRKLLIRAYVI